MCISNSLMHFFFFFKSMIVSSFSGLFPTRLVEDIIIGIMSILLKKPSLLLEIAVKVFNYGTPNFMTPIQIFQFRKTSSDIELVRRDIIECKYTFTHILCIIPVTTATAERSFSTLRGLKTYLRNNIDRVRLSELAKFNIHREISCRLGIGYFYKKSWKAQFFVS